MHFKSMLTQVFAGKDKAECIAIMARIFGMLLPDPVLAQMFEQMVYPDEVIMSDLDIRPSEQGKHMEYYRIVCLATVTVIRSRQKKTPYYQVRSACVETCDLLVSTIINNSKLSATAVAGMITKMIDISK